MNAEDKAWFEAIQVANPDLIGASGIQWLIERLKEEIEESSQQRIRAEAAEEERDPRCIRCDRPMESVLICPFCGGHEANVVRLGSGK